MKFLPIIIMSICGISYAAISMGVRIFSNSSTPVNICIGGGGEVGNYSRKFLTL